MKWRKCLPILLLGASAGCSGSPTVRVHYPSGLSRQAVVRVPLKGLESIVGFSSDGRHLACNVYEVHEQKGKAHPVMIPMVYVCNASTGQIALKARGYGKRTPTGILLVGYFHEVTAVDLNRKPTEPLFHRAGISEIHPMALSSNGKTLAAGGVGLVLLWDITSGQRLRPIKCPGERIRSLLLSPDGKLLAGAGPKSAIHIWEAASGRKLQDIQFKMGKIEIVAFSPDSKTLLVRQTYQIPSDHAIGFAHRTFLYQVETGKELLAFDGKGVLSEDGKVLLQRVDLYDWRVYDLSPGKILGTIPAAAYHLALALGSSLVAAGDSSVRPRPRGKQVFGVWNVEACKKLGTCSVEDGGWSCPALSPDGRILALRRGCGSRVCFVDRIKGEKLLEIESKPYRGWPSGLGRQIIFSPDGRRAVTRVTGKLVLIDLEALAKADP